MNINRDIWKSDGGAWEEKGVMVKLREEISPDDNKKESN